MTLVDPALPVPSPERPRGRRTAAVAVAAVGVVAVVGGGVWAWQLWSAQGPQPAQALPADTLAYLAIDLDPPGGQKVAAYDALRKFPSLKKELGLDSQDDLRRSVVEALGSEASCDLDFDDIADWAGDRLALAVVDQGRPEPVLVVQVADAEQARAGLDDVARGCEGAELGHVVDGDWAVLARNDAVAREVVADAARSSLQDDADYLRLTRAAGDPGVVTLFAAPEAGPALLEAGQRDPMLLFMAEPALEAADPLTGVLEAMVFVPLIGVMWGDEHSMEAGSDAGPAGELAPYEPTPEELALQERWENADQLTEEEMEQLVEDSEEVYGAPTEEEEVEYDEHGMPHEMEVPEELRAALQDFSGIGGVVRFADGTLELETVGDELLLTGSVAGGDGGRAAVADLPADTAAATGGDVAEGWPDAFVAGSPLYFYGTGEEREVATARFEEATGLSVPEDLAALGGDRIAVVAGPGLDFERDPAQQPVAVRVTGDADRIEAALDKLRDGVGRELAPFLTSVRTGDGVVIGPDEAYLEQVAEPAARLGESDRFQRVVPDVEGATTVTFVDFDANDWLVRSMTTDADRADAEPLDTAGLTVTDSGDEHRVVLRLTLD
ncbi:hypothetical protein [Nocardioides sp. SYSU DS0651]|uniref:hypothetical protein n=1 Tax=Nocardioides sp. SYSU DS0651 TaxID=3415955 RepID=UPI003F4C701A